MRRQFTIACINKSTPATKFKDFKKQVEKLRKEINDKILKKTKAIENVNKVSKKQAKAVNSMQNKINEMTQEVKNFQNTEQKVKTLLEGMENGLMESQLQRCKKPNMCSVNWRKN